MVLYFGVLYIYHHYKSGINFVIEHFSYIPCNIKTKTFLAIRRLKHLNTGRERQ